MINRPLANSMFRALAYIYEVKKGFSRNYKLILIIQRFKVKTFYLQLYYKGLKLRFFDEFHRVGFFFFTLSLFHK